MFFLQGEGQRLVWVPTFPNVPKTKPSEQKWGFEKPHDFPVCGGQQSSCEALCHASLHLSFVFLFANRSLSCICNANLTLVIGTEIICLTVCLPPPSSLCAPDFMAQFYLIYACCWMALPQPRILVCKHNNVYCTWPTRHSLTDKMIVHIYLALEEKQFLLIILAQISKAHD